MGISEGLPKRGQSRALTIVTYMVLFVLGVAQAVIGSFQYSRGPVPLVAIALAVLIFATCVLCGWGMRSLAGGLVPALGWIITSFVMAMPSSHGTVIITATSAGEWYLYGGAFAAAGGASASFMLWGRRYSRR